MKKMEKRHAINCLLVDPQDPAGENFGNSYITNWSWRGWAGTS